MKNPIRLIDVADRLGVHYMTAYRYVRTGRLPAFKVSGQWQVHEADLASFEAGPDKTPPRRMLLPRLIGDRLVAGDENGTYQLLENAMASGAGAEEVYLDLMSPAMTAVGRRWEAGEISVADEHVASSTGQRVISRLGPQVASRGRTKGTILLATIAEDYHYLPTALLRDVLRSHGFDAQDLGANTPTESIVERANSSPDLLAVGVSASSSGNDHIMRDTLSKLTTLQVPIVVGGGAFSGPDHITSLGPCIPSSSARDAISIFDTIHADARAHSR